MNPENEDKETKEIGEAVKKLVKEHKEVFIKLAEDD